MNNEDRFESLVARARSEMPPGVDVTNRVLSILKARHGEVGFAPEKPLMWIAVLSSAVAAPAGMIAIFLYNTLTNPFMELAKSISWVMQ